MKNILYLLCAFLITVTPAQYAFSKESSESVIKIVEQKQSNKTQNKVQELTQKKIKLVQGAELLKLIQRQSVLIDGLELDKANLSNQILAIRNSSKSQEAKYLELQTVIKNQDTLIKRLKLNHMHIKADVKNLHSSDDNMGFSTWTGILLACVTVIVTVLGVVMAIISFVGYRNFRSSTEEAARQISHDVASEIAREEANNKITEVAKQEIARLIDEGQLKEQLESAVDLIVRKNRTSSGERGGFNNYPEIDEIDEDSE